MSDVIILEHLLLIIMNHFRPLLHVHVSVLYSRHLVVINIRLVTMVLIYNNRSMTKWLLIGWQQRPTYISVNFT